MIELEEFPKPRARVEFNELQKWRRENARDEVQFLLAKDSDEPNGEDGFLIRHGDDIRWFEVKIPQSAKDRDGESHFISEAWRVAKAYYESLKAGKPRQDLEVKLRNLS